MTKKISFLILSVAILVFGGIGLGKLKYLDRSVRILKFSSESPLDGRLVSGTRDKGEFNRTEDHGLRGNARERFEPNNEISGSLQRNRDVPEPEDRERMQTGSLRGGIENGDDHGRGEFRGREKINLGKVMWFLAIFASFTVVAIYIDRGIKLIRKQKLKSSLSLL